MGKPNMIKRADGSYSKRGLWDNIRANKGSGKAPTKEMLKQERKINAKYEEGGTTDKPRFPGKLEISKSDNTRVLNTEGRTSANSKLQDQYNKNEIIQYGTNKGKPYGFENQTIKGGMESLITPDNVMMATGVGALAKTGANALKNNLFKSKSKINWGNWNKEIPENAQLMKEYNTIEQTSKANNTWMKNPDGSKFKGTPEQFVQQNSENFKKYVSNTKGNYEEYIKNPYFYHGSKNKGIKEFHTPQHFNYKKATGDTPETGIFITRDKDLADIYATERKWKDLDLVDGKKIGKNYQLYASGNYANPGLRNPNNILTTSVGTKIEKPILTGNVGINDSEYLQNLGYTGLKNSAIGEGSERVVFSPNTLKSAIGNNGMFDMTNPNIYKAVAPVTVGAGAVASTKQQKKNGGTIGKYPEGGTTEEAGNRGMMKARMALDAHFGNPSAQRMVSPNPKIGMSPEGIGTHYMASMDNYAVPLLQDKGGNNLEYSYNPAPSREDMRFESPENAQYFAEHYKEIAPMMKSNKFASGGRVPIPVNDPNDPRLRAYIDKNEFNKANQLYNDSLTAFDSGLIRLKGNNGGWNNVANEPEKDKGTNKIYKGSLNRLKFLDINKKDNILPIGAYVNINDGYMKSHSKNDNGLFYPAYKKPIIKPVYEEQQFQPDMVTTAQPATKFYQGYDFMQQTGLRPGDYNEAQIQEGMKNKGTKQLSNKFANGGRVLPKFAPGGTWAGTDAKGNAIQTTFGKSTAGQNVVTGAGIAAAAVPMLTSFIPDEQVTDSEGNVLGAKENMGKGILNSAAQGASMGMAAGPWGAAIGAGLGAIYGGVTNSMASADLDRAKQQANMRIQSKNLSNKLLTNQNNYSINSYNNDQMIAANGGTVVNQDMGNPNAELELQETFRDPMTGETGMVDGPSHDNGGIEMNLAEGTQIWSDRLKHNGRTFASLTKPIINQIANLEKGTDSNPNSRFKQNTIKLLNSQLDFFFDKQEAGKQQDEMKRTLKKQNGGVVEDMGNYHYGDGGIHIKPENKGKFTAWANAHDMGVQEAARHVMANKEDYSSTIVKRANFAKNAAGWKHAMGGYVLPKHWDGSEIGDPVKPNNSFNAALENRTSYKLPFEEPAMTDEQAQRYDYRRKQRFKELNPSYGTTVQNRPEGYPEPVRPMQTVPTMPIGYDNNAMLKSSIKPYYNNADNNYDAVPPTEPEYNFQMSKTGRTSLPTTGAGPGGVNPALFNKANYSSGDYYMNRPTTKGSSAADVTAAYEKQRSLDAEYQNSDGQGYIRNNKGELIQAGALAGSTFAQLANINRQAAPGINPNVRLTGAIPTPRFMDLSGQRGAINRAAFGAMEGAQRGFGSSASAQAFKNKARLNQLQGLGESYQNQENVNADIYNKFAGMQGDAAMREAMMNSEIDKANRENRFNFDQSRMIRQNAALATLGHGVGDLGRNKTNQYNEMERLGSISNRYDKSAYASSVKDSPERLKQGIDAGMFTVEELQKWGIPYTAKGKYGGTFKKGTIKNRSLKY